MIKERAIKIRQRRWTAETKEQLASALASGDVIAADITYQIAWSTVAGQYMQFDGAAWNNLVTAGTQGTLDQAYDSGGAGAGRSITVDSNAVLLTDTQTGASQALSIVGSGAVAGAAVHDYIKVLSAAAHTTTGAISGVKVDLSGATSGGALRGVSVTMAATTHAAFYSSVGSLALANGVGSFTYTEGSVALTVPTGDVSIGTGSLSITDNDNSTSLYVQNDTVTTYGGSSGVVDLTSSSLTTGTLLQLHLNEANLTTGNYLSAWDAQANAEVFGIGKYGATVIAGNVAGVDALTLTAGDLTLTSGHVVLTSGDVTLTSGNLTLTAGNIVQTLGNLTLTDGDLTLSSGTATFAGTATATAVKIDSVGAYNQPVLDLNVTTQGSVPAVDIDCSSAANTGTLITADTNQTGAALAVLTGTGIRAGTHRLVSVVDSGASTSSGSAFGVTAGAGGSSNLTSVVCSGAGSGHLAAYSFSGAGTGDAVNIAMANSGVGAQALVIDDGNRAFTNPMVSVTASGAAGPANADVVNITMDGTNFTASNAALAVDVIAVSPADGLAVQYQGSGHAAFINNSGGDLASIGLRVTGATGAYSTAQVLFSDNGTAATAPFVSAVRTLASDEALLNLQDTGVAGNGQCVKIATSATTGFAANEGRALNIVASGVANAAVAGASVARFAATGAWAAGDNAKYVVDIVHSGGSAGADSDYALHISAAANVGALHVDAGTSQFDEAVTIGASGVGATLTLNKTAAGQFIVDAYTIDNTATSGAVYVNADNAVDDAIGVAVGFRNTADVTRTSGLTVLADPLAAGVTALGAGNSAHCVIVRSKGNAADDATSSRYAVSILSPTVNGGGRDVQLYVGSGADYAVQIEGTAPVSFLGNGTINTTKLTAGDSPNLAIGTGAPNTAGHAGSLTLSTANAIGAGGDNLGIIISAGSGGTNADDDGDVIIRINDQATGGAGDEAQFTVENDSSSEQYINIDLGRTAVDPTTKATQAGIATAGAARPFRSLYLPIASAADITGGAVATVGYAADGGGGAYTFIDCINGGKTFMWNFVVPDDWHANCDVEVEIFGVADGAGGGNDLVLNLGLEGQDDNAAVNNAVATAAVTTAGLSHGDNEWLRVRATLAAPVVACGQVARFILDRGVDTYVGDFEIVSVKLVYRADRL